MISLLTITTSNDKLVTESFFIIIDIAYYHRNPS